MPTLYQSKLSTKLPKNIQEKTFKATWIPTSTVLGAHETSKSPLYSVSKAITACSLQANSLLYYSDIAHCNKYDPDSPKIIAECFGINADNYNNSI